MRFRKVFIALALTLAVGAGANLSAPAYAASASGIGGSHPLQAQAGSSSSHASRHGHTPNDNWWLCSSANPTSCDNTDPHLTNCDVNKQFVASADDPDSYYGAYWQTQLYYSPTCHTVWSRLFLRTGPDGCVNCQLIVKVGPNSLQVGAQGQSIDSGAYTNQWYIPCGGSSTASSSIWTQYYGTLTYTFDWYPGC
jgi:hypothetical protein